MDGAQTAALLFDCIDFISDILLVTDAQPLGLPGPRVVFVNQAFERMTGYTAAEIVGRTPRLLQGPNTDRAELQRIRTELEKGHPLRAELVNYKKNGEEFIVEMDVVPFGDDHGRPTHWVSIQRDVTARKKAEAEAVAREAQRYEALGTLSSGIAHDFNNIIAAILGNVANGSLDMQAGRMPQASMDQIRKAALRARSVVANILAYARRRSDVTAALPLAPVLQEASDLLRAILPVDVRLTVNQPTEPLWVEGDATQLCQVLLNLGINALQSLAAGERHIVFTLSRASKSAAVAAPTDGRYATIEVTDTGCGMSAATKERIFEPYFTTKGDGRGTGLGLSVVWGVVKAHGGSIEVTSEVGRGSRFQVTLPLIAELIEAPAPADPLPMAVIGRGEHVLVVDDDEVVVLMLEGMLERWGFRVTTLQDPLKAVSLLKSEPDRFDLVVTDLNMPNVSGLQLAREVLAIRSDLPIILGSGTVSEELVDAASEAGIAAVFPKEFAVERLGSLLTTSLARVARPNRPSDRNQAVAPPEEERMQHFLTNNRTELIERCASKVAQRPHREATPEQLANGVPLFLGQLIRTLSAEAAGEAREGLRISGAASGDSESGSEIGTGAAAHGKQLRALGYSVDQVVHDYGDLCQAITDLAAERDAPFSVDAYRTLNRCLDNAIANAVTAFAAQRDVDFAAARSTQESQRLGFLAHELRNYLHAALLAFHALESGKLSIAGSTGAMLKRNLRGLDDLIGQTLAEVRHTARPAAADEVFSLSGFIADAVSVARLYADETGCTLSVSPIDPHLAMAGGREVLLAALSNLLQNAFKFTRPATEVALSAQAAEGRIRIEVRDHCGGLPPGTADKLFTPFTQMHPNRQGLGLGLSIASQGVAANGGLLSVQNTEGSGCVFTIDLPAHSLALPGDAAPG